MEVKDHLFLYEKLLWPTSRTVDFDFLNPKTGKAIHIRGLVKDIERDIHKNKLDLIFDDNHKIGLLIPDGIRWDDTKSELVLEYGSDRSTGEFLDELHGAQWGESPDAALKRLSPKVNRILKISVL